MTKQNKLILGAILLILVVLLSYMFQKYVVKKDYFVYMHIPCTSEFACFEVFVDEDEEIEGDFNSVYWKMYRKAFVVESCIKNGDCDPMSCGINENDCAVITCSEDTVEDDEACTIIESEDVKDDLLLLSR